MTTRKRWDWWILEVIEAPEVRTERPSVTLLELESPGVSWKAFCAGSHVATSCDASTRPVLLDSRPPRGVRGDEHSAQVSSLATR